MEFINSKIAYYAPNGGASEDERKDFRARFYVNQDNTWVLKKEGWEYEDIDDEGERLDDEIYAWVNRILGEVVSEQGVIDYLIEALFDYDEHDHITDSSGYQRILQKIRVVLRDLTE